MKVDNGTIFKSQGKLLYFEKKLIVEVDKGIVDFYKSLIPKYVDYQPQMYDPHISVVRKEIPPHMEFWNKYNGEIIEFYYTNKIWFGEVYIFMNAYSVRFEEIRQELGLSIQENFTIPPKDTFKKTFHFSLGNFKHLK